MIEYKLNDLEKLEKELEYIQKYVVVIGVLGEEGKGAGKMKHTIATIKEYAIFNEYGTSRGIPPRPFFRQSVMTENSIKIIKSFMEEQVRQIIQGNITGQDYLENVGTFVVKRIKSTIKNGNFTANKESTLKRKKGSSPLVDTRSLINSISYMIVGV